MDAPKCAVRVGTSGFLTDDEQQQIFAWAGGNRFRWKRIYGRMKAANNSKTAVIEACLRHQGPTLTVARARVIFNSEDDDAPGMVADHPTYLIGGYASIPW